MQVNDQMASHKLMLATVMDDTGEGGYGDAERNHHEDHLLYKNGVTNSQ